MSNALNTPGMELYFTRVSIFNKEGLDAITTVIHELEQAGYITVPEYGTKKDNFVKWNIQSILPQS